MNSKSKKEISKSIQTFNIKINFVFGDMWGNFPGVEFEGMFPRGEININSTVAEPTRSISIISYRLHRSTIQAQEYDIIL